MKIFFVRHGVTESNMNNLIGANPNIPITKHGMKQAKETGKFLSKYGEFDLLICSPYLRTRQTADIINKELNIKKIFYNDLIIERFPKSIINFRNEPMKTIPEILNDKKLLARVSEFLNIKEMVKLNNLLKIEKNTTDPFELYEINKNKKILTAKMMNDDSPEKVHNDDMKFFKYLKNLKNKCILIVSHGMTMTRFLSIITNTINKDIKSIDKSVVDEDYKYYDISNCCIMGCIYDNNEKQFRLIIPPNILHLKKLALKEPNFYPIIKF